MGTKIVTVKVCDFCGSEEKLTPVTIQVDAHKPRHLLVCADKEHGIPAITKYAAHGDTDRRLKPPGPRARVYTLEEIEKIKEEERRAREGGEELPRAKAKREAKEADEEKTWAELNELMKGKSMFPSLDAEHGP